LIFFDPYQAYLEGSVFSGNPLSNVIALYEGTIHSVRHARQHFETGDIMARGKAINKAVTLLTELLVTLDHEKGAEISANLKRLYGYIQSRVIQAHAQKQIEPLFEAERLLETVLEAWRQAGDKLDAESRATGCASEGYTVELKGNSVASDDVFNETPVTGLSATF
jgi:flagellar protein FliS